MDKVMDDTAMAQSASQKLVTMVGVGRHMAVVCKVGNEERGWEHHFSVLRVPGDPLPSFLPRDVPDLARLLQGIAATLAENCCSTAEWRGQIARLSATLDHALRVVEDPDTANGPGSEFFSVMNAIGQVVEHMWKDEGSDFAANPSKDHIYRQYIDDNVVLITDLFDLSGPLFSSARY